MTRDAAVKTLFKKIDLQKTKLARTDERIAQAMTTRANQEEELARLYERRNQLYNLRSVKEKKTEVKSYQDDAIERLDRGGPHNKFTCPGCPIH